MEPGGEEQLAEWLETLNLSEYLTIFTNNGLTTLEQIHGIDKPRLNSIGIMKLGHVTRLVRAAEKLVNSGSNSPVPATGMNGSELTSSLSAPQLKRPPPVPTRRSVRRSPSPASPQKQSSLLESTHANSPSLSPDVSRSPTPTGMDKPRPAPRRHKPLSVQNSDGSILEQRRRSSPDIIVSIPVSVSLPTTTVIEPDVVEPPKPAPRRLASPSRNQKYYENVGRSTTLPQPFETCRLEQSVGPRCNPGLPPPAPPRRTTSIKTTTSEIMNKEDTSTRIPQTVSSPSLQMQPDSTNHAVQVPPIPPKISEEEEVSQPIVPPKDLFLSDLPAPVQPRISSLDALETVTTSEDSKASSEQLVPEAVTPDDASSDLSSSDVEVIAVRKVSPEHNKTTAPLYENVIPDNQPPALPPKSNTPPGFRPPTPPTSDNEQEEETVEPAISVVEAPLMEAPPLPEAPSTTPIPPQFPPPSLPPKTIHLLPPAPPVPSDVTDTEDEDYSSDDSGDRPRMVITSSRRVSTDILPVSVATPDSTITSPTSPMSPLSNTSSDAEMTFTVIQQKFTSDQGDETIAVNQPSSESAQRLIPHYDQVTLKSDQSNTLRYENVSLNPGASNYDSLQDLDLSVSSQRAPGNADYDSLAPQQAPGNANYDSLGPPQTNTIPPHYQQVPSRPRNAVYDEVELGDPLSASTGSYSSRRYTSSTDHYSSPEPNAVQTDDTYSTIPDLSKPPTPPSYSDHLQQKDSADLYASIDDESVSSSSQASSVALSMPAFSDAFPANMRDHRVPSASTLPIQPQPKQVCFAHRLNNLVHCH